MGIADLNSRADFPELKKRDGKKQVERITHLRENTYRTALDLIA